MTTFVSPQEIAAVLGLYPPTDEQAAVIAATPEPTLVVAGAGAGKTETMAARVVWLVANGIVAPERILGLTFTRKAARQLGERVRARLSRLASSGLLERIDPGGHRLADIIAGEPTILTYHAYAGRLLAEHGLRIPIQPGTQLLSETASWQLAHRVVSTWDGDLDTDRVPTTVTEQLLSLAGELGEHLLDIDKLGKYTEWLCQIIENAPRAKGQRAAFPQKLAAIVAAQRFRLELLPLVSKYQQRKRADATLDFADQMSLAAHLAQHHPEVVASERARYGSVLLDEYQDTGHAQRILLRALFGGTEHPPMPLTAVGDPAQAIYGWRGASAANLPRFTTDFPRLKEKQHVPAADFGLLTSFRNPPEILELANTIVEPLRHKGLGVRRLRAKENAEPADIVAGLATDIRSERNWVADAVAERWFAVLAEKGAPPTSAVLVRRRADMAPIASALRARGIPVEVVGLGGLLEEPEIADIVSTLRVLSDPLAGSAAARLLTGARWRLGAADVVALWRRVKDLSTPPHGTEIVTDRVEQAGLVDAIDDPGSLEQYGYSPQGYLRISRLSKELGRLRSRLDQSLPELVADVERTMLLDVEALSRPGSIGRVHLDAFADVVAAYTENAPTATLLSFVDYLTAAEHAEDGLTPGEVEVATNRVQVLTVHAAKGLEWEVVAIPHLVCDVFPSRRRTSSWLRTSHALPAALRGDAPDLPKLSIAAGHNRKEVTDILDEHEEGFAEKEADEERRLCYVALTRSERALIVSGYWWNETGNKVKGPSEFLTEIADMLTPAVDPIDKKGDENTPERHPLGYITMWAERPDTEENPLASNTPEAVWPIDPLGSRRDAVNDGRDIVLTQLSQLDESAVDELSNNVDDPDGWIADTTILITERLHNTSRTEDVVLPNQLSVSQLVNLAAAPDDLAQQLRRPMPTAPSTHARRGTAFHGWLEQRFGVRQLFDLEDLPGAEDTDSAPDAALAELQEAFLASEWADRNPHAVEVPFSATVDGTIIRGRMDAVYAQPDGGWLVVDWKTGAVPPKQHLRSLAIQLTAYRLAWASLQKVPLDHVQAAFHYVRSNQTVWPTDLLDAQGLHELLRQVPTNPTPAGRSSD